MPKIVVGLSELRAIASMIARTPAAWIIPGAVGLLANLANTFTRNAGAGDALLLAAVGGTFIGIHRLSELAPLLQRSGAFRAFCLTLITPLISGSIATALVAAMTAHLGGLAGGALLRAGGGCCWSASIAALLFQVRPTGQGNGAAFLAIAWILPRLLDGGDLPLHGADTALERVPGFLAALCDPMMVGRTEPLRWIPPIIAWLAGAAWLCNRRHVQPPHPPPRSVV